MKSYRVAFGVVLLALCVGATVSAQLPPPPPPGEPPGGGANTISLGILNTATKGQVNMGGTYTTKDAATTLTSIDGYAYPTAGGAIRTGGGATQNPKVIIDAPPKAKTWQSVLILNMTKQQYSCRVVGNFSDGSKIASAYAGVLPDGNAPGAAGLTVNWKTGFPKSTQALKISSEGTYAGGPALAFGDKYVIATPLGGGPFPQNSNITLIVAQNPSWTAPDITVATAGPYSVFALISAADGTYCTPYSTAQPPP